MTSTNDGKDVKSNQSSGSKSKTYLIELYKSLEARLSEASEASERSKHLCEAWRRVHSLCLHSAPSTHTHLLNWLQRHTARVVLQTEWQKPERKDDRKSLEDAINDFIAEASLSTPGGSTAWETQLVARGEWFKRVLEKPWDHPVLTLLLNPNGTPPTDDEVLTWLKEESGVTFVVRLHTLVGEKCDDIAVSLATAVMERVRAGLPPVLDLEEPDKPPVEKVAPSFGDKLKEEAGFTPDVWEMLTDIEFVLLHKRDSKRCIALAKQTPLLDAYPLIERLQKRLEASPREKRLWKNAREVAVLIAQVVIARCMMVKLCQGAARTALYCCARLLAGLLTSRLPSAADALAAQAPTARHLHTLAQAVDKQLSPTNEEMKPYVCELYVRAITAGMNELERLKLKTEKEAEARSMETTLASWFVQLGTVLSRSDRIACECTLTAFSLHPSQKMYERIDAAPRLTPVLTDSELKEEPVKSEFGSWANDSRSQTNLVKTSETLNLKQTQNQTNVLSTAIFNEGEALGLSPELCQDIAVLLSGPRVKTLSWDMDRTLLLENCRAYSEQTHGGTRVLTRELKYLNIDPKQYQHLPEEKDDDENDPYYGIERGYEHLAVLEEPKDIWADADSPERTDSNASSIEYDYLAPRRKKKTKRVPHSSDEDSDPLSSLAQAKRTQKKKERPHSKERSRERAKKKQEPVDPLDLDSEILKDIILPTEKVPKQKKERKKKEKVPKVIGGKRSALSNLIGLKVGKAKKKQKDNTMVLTPFTGSDYDSQGKKSLTSLHSEGTDQCTIYEQSLGAKSQQGLSSDKMRAKYSMMKHKIATTLQRPPNHLTKMQYKPQTPNTTVRPATTNHTKTMFTNYKGSENSRTNLAKLLEYRREREELQRQLAMDNGPPRKSAILRPDIPLQTNNISPKTVAIPEIPKSYINKEQMEQIADIMRAREQKAKNSVIQYANKTANNTVNASSSTTPQNKSQHSASGLKITDFVSPSYDRLMAEIAERQRCQEITKPPQQYKQEVAKSPQPYHTKPLYYPAQRSYSVLTPEQKHFQNFVNDYDPKKSVLPTRPLDMSSKFKPNEAKKPMPTSRVSPIVPNALKVAPKPVQSPKPIQSPKAVQSLKPVQSPKPLLSPKPSTQKKPEASLNTFSRLSYMHKNKQIEINNKAPAQKSPCSTSTYQEVSSELDEIIKQHIRAQMRVIQAKKENEKLKLLKAQEPRKKCEAAAKEHPFLSNLLANVSSASSSHSRNENQCKKNTVEYLSPTNSNPAQKVTPADTALCEKDHNDLLNLLRQQNHLNKSPYQYSTNIHSKPSASAMSRSMTDDNAHNQQTPNQNEPRKPPIQEKSVKSILETKIINVLSNTLLKPGTHEINKSLSVSVKPTPLNTSKAKIGKTINPQDKLKIYTEGKDHIVKKYVPESEKPEWQSVINDILKHKTPCRGPNALDVALNKSSFELAYEKSLKEPTLLPQNPREIKTDSASMNPQEKVDRPKPVITSIQNVIITKKGIKLQDTSKQQKETSAAHKSSIKQSFKETDEKSKKDHSFESTKKLPQEAQRKQFTYAGPKHDDPFISGIPNSDYDLLDELMDDDLRKEIGELSSDDESYNAAAQSFLKPTKSNDYKRVSVHFNKGHNESTPMKSTTEMHCVNHHRPTNEMLQSNDMLQPVTLKPAAQCANKISKTTYGSHSGQPKAIHAPVDVTSRSQSAPTHFTTPSNAQNQTYNKPLKNNKFLMDSNNVYFSDVPQAPVQNVVLVGSELVSGGYTNAQTAIQNPTPNAYVAVNNIPTVTLYQTTQYNAPVVFGASVTVPVTNNVSCAAISTVQPRVINNVSHFTSPKVNVEPQTSTADTQVHVDKVNQIPDSEINNIHRVPDNTHQCRKSQDENKGTERKVLSEVQDFATTDKSDNSWNQIQDEISLNFKKDTTADKERLKKKRLAILNREIYHRCGQKTIPLSYYPLPKNSTVVKKHISKAIPVPYTSLNKKEDKQNSSNSEEENFTVQIKNNLQDLPNAMNEIPSPATPDSTDSKENKSCEGLKSRRILLRSCNKIIPNSDQVVLQTPPPKKSTLKLKSDTTEAPTKVHDRTNHDEADEKYVGTPKRASKRIRNKKVSKTAVKKKPLENQCQKPTKDKLQPKKKGKNSTETPHMEYLDFESELQGSIISKSELLLKALATVNAADKVEKGFIPEKTCNIELTSQDGLDDQKDPEPIINMQIVKEKEINNDVADTTEANNVVTELKKAKNVPDVIACNTVTPELKEVSKGIPMVNAEHKNKEKPVLERIKIHTEVDNKTDESMPGKVTNILCSDTKNNVVNLSESVLQNEAIRIVSPILSVPQSQKSEKKLNSDNNTSKDESKFSSEVHKVIQPVSTTVHYDLERSNETSETSEKNTDQDQIKADSKEQDTIDLDMTVTCEEVIVPKLSPTFGNIKTARNKSVDAKMTRNKVIVPKLSPIIESINTVTNKTISVEKKKEIEAGDEVIVINDDVNMASQQLNENEVSGNGAKEITDSLNVVTSDEEKQRSLESINLEPTPKSWLNPRIKTEGIEPSIEVVEKHLKVPTNTTSDIDDDVVIIDNDAKARIPIVQSKSEVLVEKLADNDTSLARHDDRLKLNSSSVQLEENRKKYDKDPTAIHSNTEASLIKLGKSVPTSTVRSSNSSSENEQQETNMPVNHTSRNEPEIPQDYINQFHIRHLPSDDPTKKIVRITLPNGRKFKATVHGNVDVTFDVLLADPAIRSTLLNGLDCKRLVAMIHANDTKKPIFTKVLDVPTSATKIEEQKTAKPMETIDLLSDDEDSASPKKELDLPVETKQSKSKETLADKLEFDTEYGKYTILAIDKDLFIKHQNKLSQKSQILLRRVYEEPELPVHENRCQTPLFSSQCDITPLIPNQYVTGLINDIETKLASEATSAPIVIPDVVEIDDSSNDSLFQEKSAGSIPEDKTMKELKNVLLKELGVEVNTLITTNSMQGDPGSDEVEIIKEIHPPKKSTRRKIVKLSAIPRGKSCPFDDLDEQEQLKIRRRKCAIKLVRCDELAKLNEKEIADRMDHLPTSVDIHDEPIRMTEDFSIFDNIDEEIAEVAERGSSPVIEVLDVLVSLDNNYPTQSLSPVDQVTGTFSCEANWLATKSTMHTQNLGKSVSKSPIIKGEQLMPLSCNATWLTPKPTLHLQNLGKSAFITADVNNYDDEICKGLVDKVIALSCSANWFTPKSTLQNLEKSVLVSANVIECAMECDEVVDESIPLSCDANWFTTKPTLRFLQNLNQSMLIRVKVIQSDENICTDDMDDKETPLSCDANWLLTKPTQHMQGVDNARLVQVFERGKEPHDNVVHEVIPLSCKANWLATKSTSHLLAVNALLEESILAKSNKNTCNDILNRKVTSLSCEARWFTTKATIHSEAHVFEYNYMRPEANRVPSLVSLNLERIQDNNLIYQYQLLQRAHAKRMPCLAIKSLKRKSSTMKTPAPCKVLKFSGKNRESKSICCISLHATKSGDNNRLNVRDRSEDDVDCDKNENVLTNSENSIKTNIGRRMDGADQNLALSASLETSSENIYKILIDGPNESRSPSPVLDTANLVSFENHISTLITESDKREHDKPCDVRIDDEHSVPDYEDNNYNVFKDNVTNSAKPGVKTSAHTRLETDTIALTSTLENCTYPNKNRLYLEDCDDIETKLAEIVGEPLLDDSTRSPDSDHLVKADEVDDEKIDCIEGVLGNESLANTDNQTTDFDANHKKLTISLKMADIFSLERSVSKDHEYYASSRVSVESENDRKVFYNPADDVIFLPEDNVITELEEEIVDMRRDEIVDDFSYDIVTSATKLKSPSIQVTKNDTGDALSLSEGKYEEATTSLVEDSVVASVDNVNQEEKEIQLFKDVSADSIISKYLKLIQNSSDVLQTIVECEDPDVGTYYVIPIIEKSSLADIKSDIHTEVESEISNCSEIADFNEEAVNHYQQIIPLQSKRVDDDRNNDDIEAKLAKIVGEPLIDCNQKQIKKFRSCRDISSPSPDVEDVASQLIGNDKQVVSHIIVNGESEDKECISAVRENSTKDELIKINNTESFNVKIPTFTYAKGIEKIITRSKSVKRKMDMSDIKTSEKKYRKAKNIDYPKFTAAAIAETLYQKEFKSLMDYCSSVKFSYAVTFDKGFIDVNDTLKSWPLKDTHTEIAQQSVETDKELFADIEKSEALTDPLKQTLLEEINSEFDENSYTPTNIHETNFKMGFGERSGRVIQASKDGEYTTFSAATLSDVKQLQPLLPSDKKETIARTNFVNNDDDQRLKAKRFADHLNLRQKVRMFFEKSRAELNLNWRQNNKKYDYDNDVDDSNWPFGDLTSTTFLRPPPVEMLVNVVQVGQLPVSAAVQNPVTCDPRVTHVSDASPSQCSPENGLGDEMQTPIKTEYTELTTADITLPLMQEYVQHHQSIPSESQEPSNVYSTNDNMNMSTDLKSVVKIELMEETSLDDENDNMTYENNDMQHLPNGNVNCNMQYQFENDTNNTMIEPATDAQAACNSSNLPKMAATFLDDKHASDAVEKPDQIAHAMNAAGIHATKVLPKSNNIDTIPQHFQPNVTISQANANIFPKTTSVSAITLQQALAQILPPPLNQSNPSENNQQTSANPHVLHIVQGNNGQSVINKPNSTQVLHIVQNKSAVNNNGTPVSQQNTFSGLSLVDATTQQGGNQLLHIVNTANQKNANAGQLLKRVNLLTNLTNVQGPNEQKMVQFVCKSADGKSIQLPHQRSMVLRLHPLDSTVPTTPKQDTHDHSSASGASHSVNEKEPSSQEMKSRSLYEENYAKFVQNDAKFVQNGDTTSEPEKATSLPKFNQVFGKQVYQDKPDELETENLQQNSEPPQDNNAPLEPMNDLSNSPMLIRKNNQPPPSHVQPNLVQQIKQTIGPMNIQTMHGGVIYTRQIPVNIGNGQTINLITVPSTELVDDSAQKQQTDSKFSNQDGDSPIIKIVPTNQSTTIPNGPAEDNTSHNKSTNETNTQPNPQPQPVLTQMRIKLPMLSKAPQMVGGTRLVRPSFFQIQRNVIGGANQQVYQQLVLTAAPPIGQSIRLPAQVQKPKTPSDTQSSPESQMSSSTLEQLREFDMVLEQVKERSTVQPGPSSSSTNNFTKLKGSPDTTDAPNPSTSTQESPTQVLYSIGNTQPLNIVNYVNRKSTIASTTTSSFVRSPDSTGTAESPSSSTHSHVPHTVTSDSCASSCASETAAATVVQPKPKKKKPKPSTSNANPFNIKNTPKPSSQKPLEDEQTTQRILYILAEYKEQVENSPDKDKPAPRRRNNPAAPNAGSSKRKKSSSGSRRRDMSPVMGEDSCRTMGSEDSSCGTSLGECNECLESHSPEESPKKVVRRLTFEQETQVTQTRTTTTTTTMPQRNVIVTDGQAFAVRSATGKPATTVLMPANYLLPVSMVKGGQQIAIVTNRGPKLLVGAGEGGTGGTLLFQRLIGPGGLKPVLTRPGVRHIRLPTAALHNLQAFNIATPASTSVQPPDSTASPAPAPTPPDLVDTRAMSSPWPDRDPGEVKPERGNSSPEGSEPWNLPSSSIADDYGYEEIVRTDNMDRTVLDAIPDRYSPDLEAQRIFDKMFDSDSKKSMYDSRCGYDIDASDDDKAYHQVVHRKDGRHTRLTHVSAAALRHKYAILEHELRLQKSLSEECEDLGVDSPSASELFPEAELLFAPSPAHEQTIDQCHTPQPTIHTQGIRQPDLDDQIATDQLITHQERQDELDINLDDVGEIVTVGEDGMTTIPLDHEEFARSHEEFARSHPNTTFHSEPEDGEVPPFTIAQGAKGRQITFHARGVPGTVVMAPQATVISQTTVEATGGQHTVKFSDIDNIINAMPSTQHSQNLSMPSVLVKDGSESLTKFDRLLNESRDMNLPSNTASAIVHSTGNGTQVIRRVQYDNKRDPRYLVEDSDAMIGGENKMTDERRDLHSMDDTSSSERHPELFWEQSRPERKRFDFSSDSDKCCKSPYDETNSDSSGIGAHTRLDSVIKAARPERRTSDGSSTEESHPPLRTYPPKRIHHGHHSHHSDIDRSLTGKTRASDRCHDVKDESRRRASNRGVVKRGCHCCNGSTSAPKPKKSRPKKVNDYPHN